jgi:hypothetical protein
MAIAMLSDLELFQALVAKESSALAALYDRYGEKIRGRS